MYCFFVAHRKEVILLQKATLFKSLSSMIGDLKTFAKADDGNN